MNVFTGEIMLRILVGISLLFSVSSVMASSPSERQFEVLHNVHVEGKPNSVISPGYLIYYPEDYDAQADKEFPVVLFLHGAGERGASPGILSTKRSFLPGMVKRDVNFPFIIVSPLARWSMDSLSQPPYLEQVMEHVRANNRIDVTREYVAGLSQGGKGARRYAERHADSIAGLVSAAGYAGGTNIQGLVDNNVPVILSHNEDDGTISFNSSRGYYNKLIAAGAAHVIFDTQLTGGHNAWGRVFANMQHWSWLFSIPNEVSGIKLKNATSTPSILTTTSTTFGLSVDVSDNQGEIPGIDYVNIDLSPLGGGVEKMALQGAGIFSKDIHLAAPLKAGQYGLIITAVDLDGNEKDLTYTLEVQIPPNDPPTVELLSPQNGEHLIEGDPALFSIQASDPDGSIQRVELYANGELAGTATSEPYEISVTNLNIGVNSVFVLAVDDLGTHSQTDPINIIVDYLNPPPPGVERILEIAGAGRADGSSYFPTEHAFDSQPSYLDQGIPELTEGGSKAPYYQGRVGYVDFGESWFDYRISKVWTLYNPWSSGTQTPYAELWWDDDIDTINDSGLSETQLNFNSAINLPYSTDPQWALDGDFTSAPVVPRGRYLILRAPSPMANRAIEYALVGWKQGEQQTEQQAPTVSILSPGGNDEFSAGEAINFRVDASDDGVVERVKYYSDNALLGTSSTAPFSFSQAIAVAGTYDVTAVAYDDQGLSTTSDAVTIQINAVTRVIKPFAAGRAEGSQYFPMEHAFDTPPSYQNEQLGLLNEGKRAPYYSGRYGVIDFGPDWADIQILQTHTLYRAWSAGDHTPYAELWWDDDKDTVNDGISEGQINFNSATGISSFNQTQWVMDRDLSQNPVRPKGRYLILKAPSNMTSRALEYAIIGQ